MTAKQRIIALKLLDKQRKNSEYMKKLGVEVKIKKNKK